jgi:hypothetical protein
MNGPDADGYAQQATQELDDTAIRTAADQRQSDDHLAQPWLGDRQLEQHRILRSSRRESVVQRCARLVRLAINELAAHPVARRQITDRRRSGQRLNGQILTVTLRQQRRRANASIHLIPPLKDPGCHHSIRQRQPGSACNPPLNHPRNRALTAAKVSHCQTFAVSHLHPRCGKLSNSANR